MDESLLSRSKEFGSTEKSWGTNEYYDELVEIVKSGNVVKLKECLQVTEYVRALSCRDQKGSTIFHLSADKRDQEIMEILLSIGANPNVRDQKGRTPLHRMLNGGCRCELCTNKCLKCIETLIQSQANVNAEDKKGEIPLYYAARSTLTECAISLLRHGSDIYHSKPYIDENLATVIVEKLPGVMEKEFDKCIQYDDKDNSKLRIDFGLILQTTSNENQKIRSKAKSSMESSCCSSPFVPCETALLFNLLNASSTSRKGLLTHPVTQAFLHLKWLAVREYFLILRSVYFILTTLYTALIFDIYVTNCPYDYKTNGPKDENTDSNKSPFECELNTRVIISGIVAVSIFALMLLFEFYKMCVNPLGYFKTTLNYAWWILIACGTLTMLPAFRVELKQWQYPMASFGVIYAWTMNLAQVGRIPHLGVYIEVLAKVLKDFGLFLITYSSLIIAFALGFCILIPDHEVFFSIPLSFLKVILMMVGDVDFFRTLNPLANERLLDLEYAIPTYIIYTVFILVMTIVLMSLLVGLAVNDIQMLQKEAEVGRSVNLIKEIHLLELTTRSNLLLCGMASCIFKLISINKLRKVNSGVVTFSPVNTDDHTFPEEIRKLFLPYLTSCPCLHRNSLIRPAPGTQFLRTQMHQNLVYASEQQEAVSWQKYVESSEDRYNDLIFSMHELMQQNQVLQNRLDSITHTLKNFV